MMMTMTMTMMLVVLFLLASTTSAAVSHNNNENENENASSSISSQFFPGVYTLVTNGHWQQWKDEYSSLSSSSSSLSSLEPIWLHMDVLDIDCTMNAEEEVSNNNNNNHNNVNHCYIHTLIQSSDEYDHLLSMLIGMQSSMQSPTSSSSSSFDTINNHTTVTSFQYNHSLTQEWIEPRLRNTNTTRSNTIDNQRMHHPISEKNGEMKGSNSTLRHLQQQQEQEQASNSTTTTTSTMTQESYYYSTIASHEGCYLDYAGMMAWIQDYMVEAEATGLLQVELLDIGDSYLKASGGGGGGDSQGKDIHVLTVTGSATNTSTAAPMLLLSSMHGKQLIQYVSAKRELSYSIVFVVMVEMMSGHFFCA